MQEIFDVENITCIDDKEYSAIGRAVGTIKVGDIVYGIVGRRIELVKGPDSLESIVIDSGIFSPENNFVVLKIMMYGHFVEEISESPTGKLYLSGKPTANPSNIKTLVKI